MVKPEKLLSTKTVIVLSITLVTLLLIPATVISILNLRSPVPQAATCYDFTGDGRVNSNDMDLFMTHYGAEVDDEEDDSLLPKSLLNLLAFRVSSVYANGGDPIYDPRFDFDSNGKIDSKDRNILNSHLGETCPPTLRFSATRTRINKGSSTTLSWTTTRTSSVSISSVGGVAKSGSRVVKPSGTTMYTIVALGPGGTLRKSIKVSVTPISSGTTTTSSDVVSFPSTGFTSEVDNSEFVTSIAVNIDPLSELSGKFKIKISVDGVKFSREVTVLKTTKTVLLKVPDKIIKKGKNYTLEISGDKLLTKKIRFSAKTAKATVKAGGLFLGDLDGSNSITNDDIDLISGDFENSNLADLNIDGVVNSLDYSILLKNLGKKGN